MAHTSEQRDNLRTPLCGAKKKNGKQCRAFAGQGTEHPGVGACKFHGGATKHHNKHAMVVAAKQRIARLGEPLQSITSTEALIGLLRATAGHVNALHAEVLRLEELGNEEAIVISRLYDQERTNLLAIAKVCQDHDIDGNLITLSDGQMQLLGRSLRAALDDVGFPKDKSDELAAALAAHLEQLPDGVPVSMFGRD